MYYFWQKLGQEGIDNFHDTFVIFCPETAKTEIGETIAEDIRVLQLNARNRWKIWSGNKPYDVFIRYSPTVQRQEILVATFSGDERSYITEVDYFMRGVAAQFINILGEQGLTIENCMNAKLEGNFKIPPKDLSQRVNALFQKIKDIGED